MRRILTLLTCAIVAAVLGGCEKEEEPIELFEPGPPVPWSDLVEPDLTIPENEFTITIPQPTEGLFPVSVAVARIQAIHPVALDEPEPGEYELALAMEPSHDFLRWNSAFDDIRSVSEVFPLSFIAMNGEPVTTTTLIEAAQSMTGRLCLVYSAQDITPVESEVKGVLFDTRTRDLLALIHARGFYAEPTTEELEQAEEEQTESEFLLTPNSARLVAEFRFEALTRDCMLALLQHDRPVPPAPVEGWVPEDPLAPRVWPPPLDINPKPYTFPPLREQ
jgi:hypothetical protein